MPPGRHTTGAATSSRLFHGIPLQKIRPTAFNTLIISSAVSAASCALYYRLCTRTVRWLVHHSVVRNTKGYRHAAVPATPPPLLAPPATYSKCAVPRESRSQRNHGVVFTAFASASGSQFMCCTHTTVILSSYLTNTRQGYQPRHPAGCR